MEGPGPVNQPRTLTTGGGEATISDGTSRRLSTRLFGMAWAHLLNDGASNYLPGVLPAVLATLGAPVRMAGVLVTALIIGQALQPLTGRLADRLGGRSLVMLGLFLTSAGGGLLGVARTTPVLIVLLLLIGIGNSFFHPQAIAGVRSMLTGRQGLLTSVFLVGGELGRGLWPTIASLVVAHLGLQNLWIVAIPGLLTIPFLLRLLPALPPKPRQGKAIRLREHARPALGLIGYQGIRTLATYAFVTFIPILWHARGGSLVTGASIITVMTVVGVIGNLAGGQLSDRIGRRPVLIASAVATAVLIVPVAYLPSPWVWIVAGLFGIAVFFTNSTTVLAGQDIFPENRSMGSGIALGFANGLGALLVLIIGFGASSHLLVVFWILGALSLASTLLTLTLPTTDKHPQPPAS
jgi:FSR family fosmidomycin resistance protein-like MFS transporter